MPPLPREGNKPPTPANNMHKIKEASLFCVYNAVGSKKAIVGDVECIYYARMQVYSVVLSFVYWSCTVAKMQCQLIGIYIVGAVESSIILEMHV